MALKKAMGILVFSTQAVIGYDYHIQTRDAGLSWGDLSATDYGTIVQERFARARTRDTALLAAQQGGEAPSVWGEAASYGKRLLAGGEQVAEAQGEHEAPPPVCIRRGNVADC
ncbi:hypothetical protein K3552_03985 [Leisingera aquaemixtae]|uniref:hypothetical protein n=1 Tax=Leisingera aquaemixtae TaxID=1396826 RepID=UPI0021A60188|nr:hypothetical protein [Leisingera aquaemixtae]UWQ38178.1 hypothetical protein K3552_03985 [Leisingera aquaemixtae]